GRLVADAAEAGAPGRVRYVETLAEAAPALAGLVREGDLVVTLGAGDVTRVGPDLVRLLAAEAVRQ
ncbi:MAG TPA: UDP-N-acetylmuramate--L-alanine ligase, partial [Propionicimonas sp.]|nr:UDP-N-acetylmuramate--L-alanine ligase [Propionicimonas sp.]